MKVKDGEEVINIGFLHGPLKSSLVAVASQRGRMLLCPAEEVSLLSGPGRGVIVIKLDSQDHLIAFRLLEYKHDQMVLLKHDGAKLPVSSKKYQPVSRGGKGHPLIRRGSLSGDVLPEVTLPEFPTESDK